MKVRHYSPNDDTYEAYQSYYLSSLRSVLGSNALQAIVDNSKSKILLKKILNRFTFNSVNNSPRFPQLARHVGRYIFEVNGREVRVAIDAHDHRYIWSPDILAWSDVYFKTNYWRHENHIEKVVPLVNGNGFLRNEDLAQLISLRSEAKKNDLVFIARIWGGAEHNIRLFESLAKVKGKVDLLAIFPEDWCNPLEKEYKHRLDKAGVPYSMNLISRDELWKRCSMAKLNILRAGKYHCIPWRMIDLLAMGAGILVDTDFKPSWPVDLIEQGVVASLQLDRPLDTSASSQKEYSFIADKVEKLLSDPVEISRLSQSSAAYYDEHASPKSVGGYMIQQVEHWSQRERISV